MLLIFLVLLYVLLYFTSFILFFIFNAMDGTYLRAEDVYLCAILSLIQPIWFLIMGWITLKVWYEIRVKQNKSRNLNSLINKQLDKFNKKYVKR